MSRQIGQHRSSSDPEAMESPSEAGSSRQEVQLVLVPLPPLLLNECLYCHCMRHKPQNLFSMWHEAARHKLLINGNPREPSLWSISSWSSVCPSVSLVRITTCFLFYGRRDRWGRSSVRSHECFCYLQVRFLSFHSYQSGKSAAAVWWSLTCVQRLVSTNVSFKDAVYVTCDLSTWWFNSGLFAGNTLSVFSGFTASADLKNRVCCIFGDFQKTVRLSHVILVKVRRDTKGRNDWTTSSNKL